MPTSAMASTAAGLTWSPGSEPAERTSTRSPARWVSQAAAIWERPALWTQTNSTDGLSDIGDRSLSSQRRNPAADDISPRWYQRRLM